MGISLGQEHGVAKRSGILILYYFQSRVHYDVPKNAIVFILFTGYIKLSNDQELSGTEENFQGLFLDI